METPPPPEQRALAAYDERLTALRAEAAALERRSRTLSLLRLITFVGALSGGGFAVFGDAPRWVAILSGAVGAVFIGLVIAHALLVTRMTALGVRTALYERAKQRAAGDFAGFPERGDALTPAEHDYAGDLDLFGQASVFQLLNATQTGEGEATLAAWLTAPASAEEVAERQAAARELAELHAFREDLAVLGAQAGARGHPADGLIRWAEGKPALVRDAGADAGTDAGTAADDGGARARAPALVTAAKVLVPLTLVAFVATRLVGPEQLGILRHIWLVPLIAQALVLASLRPAIEPILAAAASRQAPFGRYRPVLERIERQSFRAPRLRALQAMLVGGAPASREMTSLQSLVGYADLRHSGLIYIVINTALLWDVWCALALDRWRGRCGRRVRTWMTALGQMEALASVGTFAYENPGYAFPDVVDGPLRFETEGLGHPLLPADRRVVNDVALARPAGAEAEDAPPRPAALLITGSNMSGKSTLLRAIGVNAVLALAGAPACASRLTLSPLAVRTSMRIKDSLEQGVSHFYAELTRLKRVVDSVDQGDHVLFLLDEILHGTNSRERIIGARAVVRHLLDKGAIGAVSSHDLGLSNLEEESLGRLRNVHFEELVVEGKMSFDYKLKPGVVTSANALRLMRIVGIAVNLPEA